MYRTFRSVAVAAMVACAGVLLAGCPSMSPPTGNAAVDARQQVIDATYASYKATTAAIVSTRAALKLGTISTAQARKALDAYTAALTGYDAVLVTLGAPPAPPVPPAQ